MISDTGIADFQKDGAIVLRGVFNSWIDEMITGIDRNMAHPGKYASENDVDEDVG